MALTKSIALLIQAEDQPGVLYQLTRVIASHQANISTIDIVGRWQTNASVYLELQDISDLEQLLKDIGALPVVKLIEQPETLQRIYGKRIIIIGGGATNRGVETSVREAFNLDIASVVVRECCWGSDAAAHAYSLDKAMKMYARIRSLDQVAAMLRE